MTSATALVEAVEKSGLLAPEEMEVVRRRHAARKSSPEALARDLVELRLLTDFQAKLFLTGQETQLVVGPYFLVERLGEGGTGHVFKARHRTSRQLVALKVIRRELLSQPKLVDRFDREVRAIGRLEHPNIIASRGAGPAGESRFLAMEYIEGADLGGLVRERGPLPPREACEYIRQAALGLQHAFERGLIHRDVKPQNILVAADGRVKVLDLGLVGLSRASGTGSMYHTLTESGAVMGTPDYMAPEQAEDTHTVDVRADVYGLGATLYHLLSGRVPFPDCSLIQKLQRLQSTDPPPLELIDPSLPASVRSVVRKAMARNRERRFRNPGELAAALTRALADPRVTGTEPPAAALPRPTVPTPAASRAAADNPTVQLTPRGPFPPPAPAAAPNATVDWQSRLRPSRTPSRFGLGVAGWIVLLVVLLLVVVVVVLFLRSRIEAAGMDRTFLRCACSATR